MTKNVDSVQNLMNLRILLASWTNHRDFVPGIPQGTGFFPDPRIKGHRQILDDDQYLLLHGTLF
jgi:hypothetical protein